MKFHVFLEKQVVKQLNKYSKEIQVIAYKKIEELETNPYIVGELLKGNLKGYYSIHFFHNRYRMIYTIQESEVKVVVLYTGKRKKNFYETLTALLQRTK